MTLYMLELYLKPGCPYCANSISIVESKGIKHKKHILETEEEREIIKKKHKFNTFPQVLYNGNFIGGNDDLVSIVNICEKINMIITDVNDDVLSIVSELCCELDKHNCKIKKILTIKKNNKKTVKKTKIAKNK